MMVHTTSSLVENAMRDWFGVRVIWFSEANNVFITLRLECLAAIRAGVAESLRRQPAELLYMGSIPIPSSTSEHIDFEKYLRQNIRESTIESLFK